MVRGLERRAIFHSDVDRLDLLERLDRLIQELGFLCFAFVLMANHFHLVLRTGPVPLSRFMARLNGGYASAFNRRHDRVGYVNQGRYKSRGIEDDADLLGVIAYVCRNPLEAGIVTSVEELADWPWSSYSALVGKREPRAFERIEDALALAGPESLAARDALRERVARAPDPSAAGWTPDPRARVVRLTDEPSLEELLGRVCRGAGATPEAVAHGARDRASSRARAIAAYLAVRELGIPGRLVAAALGATPSAISQAVERGRRLAADVELADN